MSALTMPDPHAAEAFYGSVFGWQADTFAMGDVDVVMWRLPGFVGGEPAQPVPRDLVATGCAGEEPGWSVDFWVGDMDATVARVPELGGTVVDGPHDLPIGRQARVADPQGATFSVTRIGA
jgi:predicted enzyme related to lactoylglutathione lyase